MKKLTLLVFVLFLSDLFGQINPGNWEYAAPFSGGKRDDGSAFSLNGFGYYGCGINEYYELQKDWWQYNPETDYWTRLEDLPGLPRQYASVLEINGEVYLVGGSTSEGLTNEVYRFNPMNQKWQKRKRAPFAQVAAAASFSYGKLGYIIGGRNDSTKLNDFWSYDPSIDHWTKMPNSPFEARDEMSAFCIGSKAFVLLGRNDVNEFSADVYQYDFLSQKWGKIDAYPGEGRIYVECQTIGSKYAICAGGQTANDALVNEVFIYDGDSSTFIELESMIEPEIRGMQSFFLQGAVYFIGGLTPSFTRTDVVQKLAFNSIGLNQNSLLVYPNPVKDLLLITVENGLSNRITQVQLQKIDERASIVLEKTIDQEYYFLDVSQYMAGVYSLKVSLSGGAIQKSKIVVVK